MNERILESVKEFYDNVKRQDYSSKIASNSIFENQLSGLDGGTEPINIEFINL